MHKKNLEQDISRIMDEGLRMTDAAFDGLGDSPLTETSSSLTARMILRILQGRLLNLVDQVFVEEAALYSVPNCDLPRCTNTAILQGWARKIDPFTRKSVGMMRVLNVCKEHGGALIGIQEKVKAKEQTQAS